MLCGPNPWLHSWSRDVCSLKDGNVLCPLSMTPFAAWLETLWIGAHVHTNKLVYTCVPDRGERNADPREARYRYLYGTH